MPAADSSSSWTNVFSQPFSDTVLSLLPKRAQAAASARQRATRQDHIPDVQCVLLIPAWLSALAGRAAR